MTAEIYRDAWGIPHLRAESAQELAHAQGRVTAVDRAWQLEVERHRSQGTSASFLGADAVGLFAMDGPGTAGSNGWLVSGERTVTGHAIVAGDPHRFIEEPGVYQQIRLACPEFDVVG
ncbi:penicillin acylase family protein, partial [Streptomyces sp. NPDC127574]|uniref:penicillin acylase family protein n=1 Tax=Streptomyces sp. NPDC127574 TaxID=3345401 RepID=UPI003631DDAB